MSHISTNSTHSNINSNITNNIARSKKFLEKALSNWATKGYDTQYGGYVEALDFNGIPLYNLNKRFRIHPRNIFSHAAGTVLGYYDGLDIAEQAFEYITKTCWQKNGGFATLSDRHGNILDTSIKTYDHTFVMLGFGWLYKATGKAIHKDWLYKVWNFLNTNMLDHDASFITSMCHITPNKIVKIKEQNPHMHMLEAMLNLVELFDDIKWKDESKALYQIFNQKIALAKDGFIREFFNLDWTPHPKKGNIIDPGHHFEWTWILEKYHRLMKEPVPMIEPIFEFGLYASNPMGLGYDECDTKGNPVRTTHRMWIQTEVIKAHIAMYRYSARKTHIILAHKAWETLFTHFLNEELGVWYDQLDDNMQNISENAPTSTLYHVVIALDEYIKFCESLV